MPGSSTARCGCSASIFRPTPRLLLHRRQIDEWMGRSQQQSLTLVPLSIYFKDGKAKVELALARGRRQYDKRQAIAKRDANREAAREARAASRGSDR
jgi:SsrA-binding protein